MEVCPSTGTGWETDLMEMTQKVGDGFMAKKLGNVIKWMKDLLQIVDEYQLWGTTTACFIRTFTILMVQCQTCTSGEACDYMKMLLKKMVHKAEYTIEQAKAKGNKISSKDIMEAISLTIWYDLFGSSLVSATTKRANTTIGFVQLFVASPCIIEKRPQQEHREKLDPRLSKEERERLEHARIDEEKTRKRQEAIAFFLNVFGWREGERGTDTWGQPLRPPTLLCLHFGRGIVSRFENLGPEQMELLIRKAKGQQGYGRIFAPNMDMLRIFPYAISGSFGPLIMAMLKAFDEQRERNVRQFLESYDCGPITTWLKVAVQEAENVSKLASMSLIPTQVVDRVAGMQFNMVPCGPRDQNFQICELTPGQGAVPAIASGPCGDAVEQTRGLVPEPEPEPEPALDTSQ